jgi:F-type H+-transporting ATPase subunit gamma
MATLQELRTRRQSILSSQKMTTAMKMVATAKFRQFQKESGRLNERTLFLERGLQEVLSVMTPSDFPSFCKPRRSQKPFQRSLWIVVGADRGLCGGFNVQLARFFRRHYEEAGSASQNSYVMVIGNRPSGLIEKMGVDLFYKNPMGLRPGFTLAQEVCDKAFSLFDEGLIDRCFVIYTRFFNMIRQEVALSSFLPFSLEPFYHKGTRETLHLLEPSPSVLCHSLARMTAQAFFYKILLESCLSEQASRMAAMENASRNGGEILRDLSLLYNRKRQSLITNELIEVISGANVG